jgi:hypothetical protein
VAYSDYSIDTRYLIRDAAGVFFSQQMLTRWINQARYQVALRTGCLRVLLCGQSPQGGSSQPSIIQPGGFIPNSLPGNFPGNGPIPSTTVNGFNTALSQESYSFQWASQYIAKQYKGIKGISDVCNVAVSWGGAWRPVMNWLPWEDFQAYLRSWNVGVTSWPSVWATNGDGENQNLWLYPVPSIVSEMEWDCICVPTPIYSDEDFDAIPQPFQNAVRYRAAWHALVATRPEQAELMNQQFIENLGIDQTASDHGKVPSPYYFDEC